jgi:hypothetical protein
MRIEYARRKPMSTLTPEAEVEDEKYLLLTPQLAGIAKAALDLLVTGV